MKYFCTYLDTPLFYNSYEQMLAIQIDAPSLIPLGDIGKIRLSVDSLDSNKQVVRADFFSYNVNATYRYEPPEPPVVYLQGIYYLQIPNLTLQANEKYLKVKILNSTNILVAQKILKIYEVGCGGNENEVAVTWYNTLAGKDIFVFTSDYKVEQSVNKTTSFVKYAKRNKDVNSKQGSEVIKLKATDVTEANMLAFSDMLLSTEIYLDDMLGRFSAYRQIKDDKLIPVVLNSSKLLKKDTETKLYSFELEFTIIENL